MVPFGVDIDLSMLRRTAIGGRQKLEAAGKRLGKPFVLREDTSMVNDFAVLMGLRGGMTPASEFVLTAARQLHSLVRWESFGFPTFELTSDLVAALLLTDCSGLRGETLRWPFPAFCVALPVHKAYVSIDVGGQPMPVNFLMFHSLLGPAHDQDVKLVADNVRFLEPLDAHIYQRVHWRRVWLTEMFTRKGVSLNRRVPALRDEEPVERWLHDECRENETISAFDVTEQRKAYRLLANLAFYLSALQHAPADGSEFSASDLKAVKCLPRGGVIRLGQGMTTSKALRDAAKHGRGSPGWRVSSRFIVRGHWRNQAHGPQRSLRRKRWIQPHWKGPTAAPELDRLYRVMTPPEPPPEP